MAIVGNASAFYSCVDKDGNSIITDTPPEGAKCESRGGDDESMPTSKSKCSLIEKNMEKAEVEKILGVNTGKGNSERYEYNTKGEKCVIQWHCYGPGSIIFFPNNPLFRQEVPLNGPTRCYVQNVKWEKIPTSEPIAEELPKRTDYPLTNPRISTHLKEP